MAAPSPARPAVSSIRAAAACGGRVNVGSDALSANVGS